MGSIASPNPGLPDLPQALSSADASLLSSRTDIVQLSPAAVQLQSVDAMFGHASSSSKDPTTQALDTMLGVPGTSSTDPATQALDALLLRTSDSSTGSAATNAQAAEPGALLGSANLTGSLLDVTG